MRAKRVEFKRGGDLSREEVRDKIFDRPPLGSLYKWGGRFPLIIMLIGRSENRNRGIFKSIGSFRGGGRRKTEYRLYSPKNRDTYELPYDAARPIPEKLWPTIKSKHDEALFDDGTHWERVERATGIKPILPTYEGVSFHRAKSEREIKSGLFGFRPGQLVTPKVQVSGITQSVAVIEELFKNARGESAQLFSLGYIFHVEGKDPYFDGMSGMAGTHAKPENFRLLTDEEMEVVSEYVHDPKNAAWLRAKKRDFKMRTDGKDVKILI